MNQKYFISVPTDDFEEATVKKERARKLTPKVYNEMRLLEKPMPLMVLLPDNQNVETESEKEDFDPLNVATGTSITSSNDYAIATNSTVANDSATTNDSAMLSLSLNDDADLDDVLVKSEPEPQFRNLENDELDIIDEIENTEISFEAIDGDIMVQRVEFIPPPLQEQAAYQVKINDVISGNLPFATDVCV